LTTWSSNCGSTKRRSKTAIAMPGTVRNKGRNHE
jgi:hypothetical protein